MACNLSTLLCKYSLYIDLVISTFNGSTGIVKGVGDCSYLLPKQSPAVDSSSVTILHWILLLRLSWSGLGTDVGH